MKIARTIRIVLSFKLLLSVIIVLVFLLFIKYYGDLYKMSNNLSKKSNDLLKPVIQNFTNIKYILLWTNPKEVPFNFFGNGQNVFKQKKCRWDNCYVTSDRFYLGDYTEFEVIAFNGPSLSRTINLPLRRSSRQKYVYANIESAYNYPICSNFNDYFNWTWTYKLNSDAQWSYMIIREASGKIIGPSTNIEWIKLEDMKSIDIDLKEQLKNKTKAAAWFGSNCITPNSRSTLIKKIDFHLRKFNLSVDTYGKCGKLKCPTSDMSRCLDMIKKDYYFYLAFENSFSEDYVTEKILHALHHDAIPIVYGGANYSRLVKTDIKIHILQRISFTFWHKSFRFMANHMYLNAREMSPHKLANLMNEIILNQTKYFNYFKWKKYYTYHFKWESSDTDDYCHFCEILNDEKIFKQISIYKLFNKWWNPADMCNK